VSGHEDRFIERLQKVAGPPELLPPQEEDEQAPASVETVAPEEPTPPVEKPSFVPISTKNVFGHHDTHPLILDAILLDKYGPIWLDWEPETIWSEINDDFKQAVSVHNRNKIQAVRLCHLVDSPWTNWEIFVLVAQAFNNNVPNFRTLQRPTIAQITNTVAIMDKIKSEKEVKFSEEVFKFIAACFMDEGVVYLPPPFQDGQRWASVPKYRCSKCGKIDIDDGNGMCDSCGAPDQHLVKELERDYRSVKERYWIISMDRANNPSDPIELSETPEDVQTAKLLVADEYTKDRQRQLEEQMRILRDVRSYV
jgi:DNA-directed RNA polymerase subunit RPC12/RpoP